MIKFDKKQDKIAIIAPASAIRDRIGQMDKLMSFRRLNNTIRFFEDQNFICTYDEKIFAGDALEYFSAPKSERLRQLKNAIIDPAVKIILAFRGGYGSGELAFDCLDILPPCNKILIGFSDITALHFLFNQHYGFPSIHSVMDVKNIDMLQKTISVLSGSPINIALESINALSKKGNIIYGEMVGGNLTLICNMIGTKLHPETEDKILFMEDIGEQCYKVHRNLLHMYNSGLFHKARAVVFGKFELTDKEILPTIIEFTHSYLANIPTYMTNLIGHGNINYPVIIGGRAEIHNDNLAITSPFEIV
jgi:muramoyltetrapeptide carboxypeptidase